MKKISDFFYFKGISIPISNIARSLDEDIKLNCTLIDYVIICLIYIMIKK